MSLYEGAPFAVLVSWSGRSRKAHLLKANAVRDVTLCGQPATAWTERSGEDVCQRCSLMADRIDKETTDE